MTKSIFFLFDLLKILHQQICVKFKRIIYFYLFIFITGEPLSRFPLGLISNPNCLTF